MIIVRTLIAIILSLSLATLPARVNAIGISSGMNVAAGMPDCPLMKDDTGASDEMIADAGDSAPMANTNNQLGHSKGVLGACFTFCNSIPLSPVVIAATGQVTLGEIMMPDAGATLDGIGVSPEPHPPKFN